jgi:hypothetical protein
MLPSPRGPDAIRLTAGVPKARPLSRVAVFPYAIGDLALRSAGSASQNPLQAKFREQPF